MKHILTPILLALSLTASAQTKPGLFAGVAAESNNVTRDQRLLIGLRSELGYRFGVVGLSANHHLLINANRASSLGLKASGYVGSLYGVHGNVYAEADRYLKPIDDKVRKKFEYRFGAQLSMKLVKGSGVLATAGYQKLIYNQLLRGKEITKSRNGGSIGVIFEL